MQTIRWCPLLALGMLVVPILGRAQGPAATPPRKLEPTTSLDAESAQAGVAGKWYAEASLGPRLSTMEFKVDGTKLTGTVSRYTDSVRIYDGTISGSTISFKYKSPDSFRTISLVGKVSAAEIAFTRTVTVDTAGKVGLGGIFGGSGSPTFIVTRTMPDLNAPPPDLKPTFTGPQPKLTEIATIPGIQVDEMVRTPNGRFVIYTGGLPGVFSYNLATKQSTPIVPGGFNVEITVSPRGDRVVFMRIDDITKSEFGPLWAVAINPATGLPTAPLQRVTLSNGFSPAFSPDGKSIAFVPIPKDLTPSTPKDSGVIAVIPAVGGAERIVTKVGPALVGLAWSGDGKWIYLKFGPNRGPQGWLSRVSVTGGQIEQVLSYGHPENAKTAIDARVAFFDVGPRGSGRIGYLTANGGRGEFKIPGTTGTGTSGLAFGPPKTVSTTTTTNALHVLDLGTGKVRDLPAGGVNARSVSWSPDQKRLAFATGEGANQEIVVMNADGTAQRHVQTTGGSPSWNQDGSALEYSVDNFREIRELNVATGVSHVVTSVAAPNALQATNVWQPDGKSFVASTWEYSDNKVASKFGASEVRLDGTRRELRNVSADVPSTLQSVLITPRLAAVATGQPPQFAFGFVLVPLDGGTPRPVPMPALEPGERLSTVWGKSERWFAATRQKNGQQSIQLMSTGTDSTRLLRLPAGVYPQFPMIFLPDGRNLLIYNSAMGAKDVTIYLVPLDGTEPRLIAHLPPGTGGMAWYGSSLSADGKSLAFFAGNPTTHVYDVDLTAILQLINKKP